jgi:hypothetical protein
MGQKAAAHQYKQMYAVMDLMEIGTNASAHCARQGRSWDFLAKFGQFKMVLLNKREIAFDFLETRMKNAVKILLKKKQAFDYLRNIALVIWGRAAFWEKSRNWLVKVAKRSVKHSYEQLRAVRRLQYKGNLLYYILFSF